MARLIKQTVLVAGLRSDLPEAERLALFCGHSLRTGLASSAQVDERYVQKHLGHASVEMTRRYQRNRDRFRILSQFLRTQNGRPFLGQLPDVTVAIHLELWQTL